MNRPPSTLSSLEQQSPSGLPEVWQRQLLARQQATQEAQLWRQRRPRDGAALDFASNDYLGLAGDPAIAPVLAKAAASWGCGAGSAQLLGGYHPLHEELEAALASWLNRPAAVLFSTGYMANLGLIGALVGKGDMVVEDKLNHASLIDAARLSGAGLRRFQHNDAAGATRQLALPARCRLLVVESLFSMDGDLAPLDQLAVAASGAEALLCVDEAHALGVMGDQGAGACSAAGLHPADAPIIMGTFGKSLGTFGAFVAGPKLVTDALVNHARSHIYTTASPPALAAATLHNLKRVQREHWRRERLDSLIAYFRRRGNELGLPLGQSLSAIQPMLLGSAERALKISNALLAAGFHVPAIRPPTVPAGGARLRVSLNASHQTGDLERLLLAIAEALDDEASDAA